MKNILKELTFAAACLSLSNGFDIDCEAAACLQKELYGRQ